MVSPLVKNGAYRLSQDGMVWNVFAFGMRAMCWAMIVTSRRVSDVSGITSPYRPARRRERSRRRNSRIVGAGRLRCSACGCRDGLAAIAGKYPHNSGDDYPALAITRDGDERKPAKYPADVCVGLMQRWHAADRAAMARASQRTASRGRRETRRGA